MEVQFVDQRSDVPSALESVASDVVGVDVERSDGLRYFRSASLIQVGVEGRCVLLDADALPELPELAAFLADRRAVLHALENDLDPLEAASVEVSDVADTAVAAAMLGLPTGLGPLLAEVLGVELTEDKERFQRADWSERPLPEDMIEYAAGDVVHLPELWQELRRRLVEEGRLGWYEQELAATVVAASEDRRSWRRTKGVGRLDGHGRAILRELWETREEIARREDVAPQHIARDDVLIALADDPPASRGVLADRGLRRRQIREWGDRLLEAVRRGATSPDEPAPSGARRSTDEDRVAYDRMRRARAEVAEELGLDSGVLCPSRVLWTAVLSDPDDPQALCEAAGLRPWQCELLRDRLWEAYRGD